MNPGVGRATPDSEALASSEDERPWPTAPSFGTLPRKENGVPGIGGGIWSNQKRSSSFKMDKAAQRNVTRDLRLAAPMQARSGLRADNTPSPAASEGSAALPFAIPLQPTAKAVRSLSHSQGQREFPQASNNRTGNQPGVNDHAPALPLGLLTEEVDTETESEFGGGLTHTTSHPPIGTLHRTATYPPTYESYHSESNGQDSSEPVGLNRRFLPAFANLAIDQPQRRSQWQSHLGWDDVANVNESRRHSLADIPTRRGSIVGADARGNGGEFWPDSYEWEASRDPRNEQYQLQYQRDTGTSRYIEFDQRNQSKATEQDEQESSFEIPTMYKVPFIKLAEHERSDQDRRGGPSALTHVGQWRDSNRPRKMLYIVSFKCSRVDVFYLLDNTGLFIKEGDIVIVEADRGQDLGTVQHANVTPDDARLYKRKYGEEQYKWLMMFSKNNSQGSVNPNAQVYGENAALGLTNRNSNLLANAPATMQGLPRDNFNNLKPKAIKRLASSHEIRMLGEKEGNEAKAKRTCQQKVAHLHLDMEILDAEWQWDFQKLIFYYYADHYINFKDLITDLYRIYKTRIWLSAINPASFSQHALGQPPSGIGPGAITGNPEYNNTYTMTYGADPDPYGAVPPYRIGYETYTPNYPAIPGVANSFAPPMGMGAYQPYGAGAGSGEATPSVPPGVTPTGTPADYNYYYDRSGNESQQTPGSFIGSPNPYAPAAAVAPTDVYGQMFTGPPSVPHTPALGEHPAGPGTMAFRPLNTLPCNNAAPGFARPAGLPPPIGTRSGPSGTSAGNAFAGTAMGGIGGRANSSTAAFQPRGQFNRAAQDFVPTQPEYQGRSTGAAQMQGGPFNRAGGTEFVPVSREFPLRPHPQASGSNGNGTAGQASHHGPQRGTLSQLPGGGEAGGRAFLMQNYLRELPQSPETSRNNDTPREE